MAILHWYRTLSLLSDGARKVIGEHILLHFSHLEGFVNNFSHLEGFVDNFSHLEGFVDNFIWYLERSPRGDLQFCIWKAAATESHRARAPSLARTSEKREKRGSRTSNLLTNKQVPYPLSFAGRWLKIANLMELERCSAVCIHLICPDRPYRQKWRCFSILLCRGGNCARQESWNNADISTFPRRWLQYYLKSSGIMSISPPKARDAPWGSAPRGIPRFCRGYWHYSPWIFGNILSYSSGMSKYFYINTFS